MMAIKTAKMERFLTSDEAKAKIEAIIEAGRGILAKKKSKISLKAVVTSKQLRRHSVFSWSRAKYKTRKFEYTIQSLFQWASSFRIPLRNTWGMFKKSLRGLVINKTMLFYKVNSEILGRQVSTLPTWIRCP